MYLYKPINYYFNILFIIFLIFNNFDFPCIYYSYILLMARDHGFPFHGIDIKFLFKINIYKFKKCTHKTIKRKKEKEDRWQNCGE